MAFSLCFYFSPLLPLQCYVKFTPRFLELKLNKTIKIDERRNSLRLTICSFGKTCCHNLSDKALIHMFIVTVIEIRSQLHSKNYLFFIPTLMSIFLNSLLLNKCRNPFIPQSSETRISTITKYRCLTFALKLSESFNSVCVFVCFCVRMCLSVDPKGTGEYSVS